MQEKEKKIEGNLKFESTFHYLGTQKTTLYSTEPKKKKLIFWVSRAYTKIEVSAKISYIYG